MIKGIDVSHWNDENAITTAGQDCKFVIIKATEGKSMRDNKMLTHVGLAKQQKLGYGFYHFAHPELNSAVEEASHFVQTVKPYIGKAVLVLDFEGKALGVKNCQQWAETWLDTVFAMTGVRPLIYVQESALGKFKELGKRNYGLWVAKWVNETGNTPVSRPKYGTFPFWAMWQYCSKNRDWNLFNGTIDQFNKYAEVNHV